MSEKNVNWAGNLTYLSQAIHQPESIAEIQTLVAQSSSIKTLGTRHCFNDIADTQGEHISLQRLNRILYIDTERNLVRIEGGVRYGELGSYLHDRGFALPNLASLPHITVAGAVATATHGSGISNQSLASSIRELVIVTADGELVTFSHDRDPDAFAGAVVNLGALGVVVELTLSIVPNFSVRQDLFQNLPLIALEESFEALQASAYSVSLFTDWQADGFHQVWLKTNTNQNPQFTPPATLFGAQPATQNLHPLPGHPAECCTTQLGDEGPWHERLPHFKLDFTPSSGAELQSEYFIDRKDAYSALLALFDLREQIAPLVFVSEIRCIKSDDLWLSPYYQRDSVAFHFTWQPRQAEVSALLPTIEAALEPFAPRAHWGKLFTLPPQVIRASYPCFDAFVALQETLDPSGKFKNRYLARLFD